MIICFLEDATHGNCDGDGDADSSFLKAQISLLLCTMEMLLHHKTARDAFLRLHGYKALGNFVAVAVGHIGLNDFSPYDRKENGQLVYSANDEVDDDKPNYGSARNVKMTVTTVLLSLLFGQQLTVGHVEALGDVTCAAAVRHDLLVKNIHVLDIMVQLVQSVNARDIVVGLNALEVMLRLSPMSVIALEKGGGLGPVGRVIARMALVAVLLRNDHHFPARPKLATDTCTNMISENFHILQSASNILVRVAVLNAEVNVEVLAFFTYILRENSLFHHRCLSSHHSSSPNTTTKTTTAQRCANCETEAAVFECTDGSCIRDEMFALCVECDKVFHKSVLKRSHIRIPVMEILPDSEIMMGGDLRAVIEEQLSVADNISHGGAVSSSAREVWEGAGEEGLSEKKEFLGHASCLLLGHVKSIINDRQVRNMLPSQNCLFVNNSHHF